MKEKRKKKEFWHKRHFVLSADVFETDIAFFINMSEKEIAVALKKMAGDNYEKFDRDELERWDENAYHGRMIPFLGGFIVLLKADKDSFRKFVGILVHEITHVVQYLLRNRRIPLSEDTEEVHAYLSEFLTRTALNKLY